MYADRVEVAGKRKRPSQTVAKGKHVRYKRPEPRVSSVINLHAKLSATSHWQPAVSAPTKPNCASDLEGFLQKLHLEKYLTTFEKEEIDMWVLLHMEVDDLKIIGIKEEVEREKILKELEVIRRNG